METLGINAGSTQPDIDPLFLQGPYKEEEIVVKSGQGTVEKGQVLAPQVSDGKHVKLGTIAAITLEDVSVTPDGSKIIIKGNCNNKPVLPGSVVITETFTGNTFTDDRKGNLKGTGAMGFIDYNSGDWVLIFVTAPSVTTRTSEATVALGAFLEPATPNGFCYEVTTGGDTASSEPTMPTTIGETVTDGTAVLTCRAYYSVAYNHFGNAGEVELENLKIYDGDDIDASLADKKNVAKIQGNVNVAKLTPTITKTNRDHFDLFKKAGFILETVETLI